MWKEHLALVADVQRDAVADAPELDEAGLFQGHGVYFGMMDLSMSPGSGLIAR